MLFYMLAMLFMVTAVPGIFHHFGWLFEEMTDIEYSVLQIKAAIYLVGAFIVKSIENAKDKKE